MAFLVAELEAAAGASREAEKSLTELDMHLVIIGGSDAGISAALSAQELEPDTEVTVLVADDYPNFSICGLPYFLSAKRPTGVLPRSSP